MNWYKTLSVHQRIFLKSITKDLCGMSWEELGIIEYSMKDKIQLIYFKMAQNFDI